MELTFISEKDDSFGINLIFFHVHNKLIFILKEFVQVLQKKQDASFQLIHKI